jgi:hypothetical protein
LILSEQRTGKTRVAVATCIEKCDTGSTILVVCPKSAQAAWFKEFEEMNKYRKNELFKVTLIKKIKDIKDVMEYHSDCLNVRIITNGLFKILSIPQIRNLLDLSHTKKVMFISDESHILRNFKTMQSDAIFNFKDICVRNRLDVSIIGITGTPAIKEDSDVFGVLSLINFSKIQFRPYEVSFNMFKEHFYNCEDTSYGKKCKSLRREQELTYLLETNSVQSKKKSLDIFRDYKVKTELFAYRLDNIIPPSQISDGGMQLAEMGDLDTLAPMWQASAFEMEGYEFPIAQCREEVGYMIWDDRLYIWRDENGEIMVTSEDGADSLPEMLAYLNRNGIRVYSSIVREPTLEDVYLQSVGRMTPDADSFNHKQFENMMRRR